MQTEQLPVYPANIQGELRLILQNKDLFLLCYKYLEDYRRLNEEQNRIITKDFIEEQLKMGEDEIDELKLDESHADNKLGQRLRHNETLLGQLSLRGMSSFGDGNPRKNVCRSPTLRRCRGLASLGNDKGRDFSLFDNIALAIEEIQRELKDKMKPLCEFYRDLFYLQLHFTLVLTQVCNYCMPLVTENIGLIDRIFFWADRPEFELVRKSSEISDRLKDIYTRTQSVLTLLVENVMFVQNKVELQRNLEKKFQERLDMQLAEKDYILRKIHFARLDLDHMDEENDRLVGVLVKLDPKYVGTEHFNELADFSVKRNLMEGRLTPEGYRARKQSAPTATPKTSNHLNTTIKDTNENSSQNRRKENENLSNIENPSKLNVKIRRKHSHSRKHHREQKADNAVETTSTNDMINVMKNFEKAKFTPANDEENRNNVHRQSIKERLLSKTKGIFDSTFKKSARPKNDNYVKVFEGEILAELSRFTPLCQTPSKANNSWDYSKNDNSMERSLKRKYDLRESQLHENAYQPMKRNTASKYDRNKKDIIFSSCS